MRFSPGAAAEGNGCSGKSVLARTTSRGLASEPDARATGPGGTDTPIRVFLVSDVRVYRDLITDALSEEEGFEVTGSAAGDVAGMAVAMSEPGVVLVDAASVSGLAAVRALAVAAPEAKIVAVGISDDEHTVIALVEAGVAGYVTADQSLVELVAAVEAAVHGELPCSPRVSAALAERVAALAANEAHANGGDTLTPRQREIATLIAEGLSNKQIARRLSIERATVKNHVHNILAKLGVSRRDEVTLLLRLQG
jgi:two-component system nitrate/nitrite response regulator NarL